MAEGRMDIPSEINLTGSSNDVARWIWKTLVPNSGQAPFVQAEILRAIEKLRWEAQNNGNINWDDRFELLADYIEEKLASQQCFDASVKASIRDDLSRLRGFTPVNDAEDATDLAAHGPYVHDDLYDRLTEHLIVYCRSHPQLIPHVADPRQYR
jgi:hypothetical protein